MKVIINIELDDQTGRMAVYAPTNNNEQRLTTAMILAQAIQIVLNLKDKIQIVTPDQLPTAPINGKAS